MGFIQQLCKFKWIVNEIPYFVSATRRCIEYTNYRQTNFSFTPLKLLKHCRGSQSAANRRIHCSSAQCLKDRERFAQSKRKKRSTPYFSHVYRNSFSWLRNKIDFWILRFAWDRTFDENEFKRGAKQAIVTVSRMVSRKDMRGLKGLVTANGLSHIDKEIHYHFPSEHLHLLSIANNDIKLVLPIRLYFVVNKGRRECNIDVLFVSLRRLEDIYSAGAFRRKICTKVKAPTNSLMADLELQNKQEIIHTKSIFDHEPETDTHKESKLKEDDRTSLKDVYSKFNFGQDVKQSLRYGFPVKQKMVCGGKRDILFTEMFARLQRDYGDDKDQWTIAYYKVTHIELLRDRPRHE